MSGKRADDIQVDANGQPFVEIAGIKARVVDELEAETCSAVVCGNTSFFADDVRATCSGCGAAIVHRPYVPKTPPKICHQCFVTAARAAAAREGTT
jgi:hypothetical protein